MNKEAWNQLNNDKNKMKITHEIIGSENVTKNLNRIKVN